MIAVFALERLCDLEPERAHATAISIMLPLSVVSLTIYLFKQAVEWGSIPFVAPAVFVGSLIGAKLLGRISSIWLNRIFSLFMLFAAVWMLI